MNGRFVRLSEVDRAPVSFFIDRRPATGLEGDTLMVAVLNAANSLRFSEFGDGARAGFCLMGACQDCWLWTESGKRLRACTTPLVAGMRVLTKVPEEAWPNPA